MFQRISVREGLMNMRRGSNSRSPRVIHSPINLSTPLSVFIGVGQKPRRMCPCSSAKFGAGRGFDRVHANLRDFRGCAMISRPCHCVRETSLVHCYTAGVGWRGWKITRLPSPLPLSPSLIRPGSASAEQ